MADQHHDEPRPHPDAGHDPEYLQPAEQALEGGPHQPLETTHPRGLWVLFITEMWERFSYYGMRALLVLFLYTSSAKMLADGTANGNPGFGWSEGDAYLLYGVYTFMVYLGSIFGGIAADRTLGTHRSMLLGGWIIALGHITLALSALFSYERGVPVTMESGPGALIVFMLGLSLIIIGTGLFKPCVSVMVGQLYGENDPRRDSGFTIFYMGINLGAFLSPLVAGTLGEKIGWHWGFGSAAVGMLLGLFFYQVIRPKYLHNIGLAPSREDSGSIGIFVAVLAALVAIPAIPLALFLTGNLQPVLSGWTSASDALGTYGMAAAIIAVIFAVILAFLFAQPANERGPLGVIIILAFLGNIFFWTAFEQAGSTLNVFALDNTDRTLWGLLSGDGFPATWYQSVNPLAILIFAPVFAWLWVWLDRRRLNPSTPLKFSIGLWLLGLGFLAMVVASLESKDGLAGPQWLLLTFLISTWGELCLSPVGLSMVTKLAPQRLQSQMMGFWFFTMALSNLFAGLVAKFSTQVKAGDINFIIDGLPGFFLMLVLFPFGMGIIILLLTPVLKRMMHGVK